jgi:hypothetical protein
MAETWLKCTACKNPISYGATHWVCSVSTCNRRATRYVFCTVSCWDSHVAVERHRDAWAVEARAPSKEAWEKERAGSPEPEPAPQRAPTSPGAVRRVIDLPTQPVAVPVVRRSEPSGPTSSPAPSSSPGSVTLAEAEREALIVVSKMKKYIKERSGMNCSDAVAEMLSEHVRAICDDAIRAAARDERKTVLDRDVPRPLRR